jgi:F-type H+-transporting ATPase subunit delta
MEEGTIGRRWARALVESVEGEKDLKAVDEQLTALGALLLEKGDFREAMLNPSFANEDRAEILAAIADKNKFHATTKTFLALLVQKERVSYLPSIARAFQEAVDDQLGRVRATIESANELKAGELKKVVKALETKTGKEVVAEVETVPELVAGLRARIGGLVFDNSVRSKIERLRQDLAG